MRQRAIIILAVAVPLALSCVTKKKFTAQKAEADNCYEALQKENASKKELADALSTLQTQLAALTAERERLASEKGSLEGSLSQLESDVAAQVAKIQALSEAKSKLEAEREELAAKTETYDELVKSLEREMSEKLIEVKRQGQRITVNVSQRILFDSGSIVLKTRGSDALSKIAEVLAKVDDKRIDVEGHTDNLNITGKLAEKFPTNWELSAMRATNVVRYLEEKGVNPKRMAAVGKSKHRPVASNSDPKGRRLNRRIEIVLTPWDGGKI